MAKKMQQKRKHKKPIKKAAAKVAKAVKKAPKKVDVSQLRGFARLAALDPDRLKTISARAGRKAQKLYGHKVRWSKKKAKALAPLGGKAAQKKYKETGHPWAAGSPLRVDSSKARRRVERDRRARRDRSDRRQLVDRRSHRRPLPGAPVPPQETTTHADSPVTSIPEPVAQTGLEGVEGVSLVPSNAQPEAEVANP